MTRERYSGGCVLREEGVVYLALYQSDKEDLIRQGYAAKGSKVLTVHEAQGQTFEHVRYVRTSPKALNLYESEGHAIVAISRHTRSFVYYSDVDDIIVNWMNKVRGHSEVQLIRWNDERKLANGESLVGGYCAPQTIEFKPENNNYAGPEATAAMSSIIGAQHNPRVPMTLSETIAAYPIPRFDLQSPRDTDIGYLQSWYDDVMPVAELNLK
ncbi:unnamed protein product, partial [Brenthis ino]